MSRTEVKGLSLGELPDRELVRRSQRGEQEAFGELVQRHQDKIYNFVFRSCGHAEDAGDITQRVFINAFRKIDTFKGDSAFSTWIYRIAFNQFISFRRERRHREASLTPRDEEGAGIEPAEDRSPSEPMESEETRKKVQQAIDLLEEEDRRIILLKDLQGHSYDDIAAILGVPKGTVRSRLHRARLELRTKLKTFMGTLQP